MAKVTIEDISRQTGLSRGTVSRALNNRPDISEQTKQRVLEACRTLNYSPSHAARSLATGRAYALGVLLDDLQSVFSCRFLRGVLLRAQQARYAVHVAELRDDPVEQANAIKSVVSGRIDAVLIAAPYNDTLASTLQAHLEKRPAVSCVPYPDFTGDLLLPDQVESGRLAARHLFEVGGRSVLYVHVAGDPGAGDRLSGVLEVCRAQGVPEEDVVWRVPGGAALASDEELPRRLAGVRAVAASSDYAVLDVMLASARAGRRAGVDLAVIGQGNECFTTQLQPALTSTDLGGEELGQRAVQTVLARVEKTRQDSFEVTHVAPRLLVRDSSHLAR